METFIIPGKPQGKARARTFYNPKLGRSQSITPEKTVLYENLIKQCGAEIKGRYFNGQPLRICVTAVYDIPKSTPKKLREQMLNGQIKPTKKPDADNVAKVVCDALNGVIYYDDTQVTTLFVQKEYGEEPKVIVKVGIDG